MLNDRMYNKVKKSEEILNKCKLILFLSLLFIYLRNRKNLNLVYYIFKVLVISVN